MRSYRDSRLTYVALSVFFLVVAGYAAFEARGIVLGPRITISSDISESAESFIIIDGHAERIASLSMNGRAVVVTETGVFAQPYLLAPGYNRIVFDATDRYGRTRTKVVEIVYTGAPIAPSPKNFSPSTSPEATSSTESASSTEPIAQ